ncbi:3-hydroxyacyl-CoA dehydrogenase family protein [Pleomorphovibrio marinus]|uniref:3-hydroxyacyl-CoA dehydrogenase family protein n=1 Tax=Pleomorphovibrio marinus TaxID=2164132 RepID=UPI000E0A868F|nr:3-hydroxyacyl-CoA dehydrogenase NAD-binding domain-containing protein [Pleomorphovibrio marinus]
MKIPYPSIAVIGEGQLFPEISLCLLKAGHHVLEYCPNGDEPTSATLAKLENIHFYPNQLKTLRNLRELPDVDMVVLVSPEDGPVKRELLREIVDIVSPKTVIAVNTESFSLDELRVGHSNPKRIIGLNWVQPAHITLFSELIVMPDTPPFLVDDMVDLATTYWGKDPYVVHHGNSIRSRLMAAMIREAFFLMENGYVTEEDIDRACRNDAGYYLPFAGNLRYMDLMGTYVYGVVMKDLNNELATNQELPAFFQQLLAKHPKPGLATGEGFYRYTQEEKEKLKADCLAFGKKIRALMDKFPFPRDNPYQGPKPLKESMVFPDKNRSL